MAIDYDFLGKKAYELRKDVVSSMYKSPLHVGHVGGALSSAEIISVLYYNYMKIDPKEPYKDDRDIFIMSKGHCWAIQFAALADLGYISREDLWTYKTPHSKLQGHPDFRKCPGLEVTSGSLGQGLSYGLGFALAFRRKKKNNKVFVLAGESEFQEGMFWEALMAASHYGLNNIVCYIDRNRLQVCGDTDKIMNVEPLTERLEAFGWHTARVNGNDVKALCDATDEALVCGRPAAIICDTIKGKGVSYMEGIMEWHSNTITDELYRQAMAELDERLKSL